VQDGREERQLARAKTEENSIRDWESTDGPRLPLPRFGATSQKSLAHCSILELLEEAALLFRLDYLSCVLTVISTILLGKRCWEGWILAAVNSAVVCVIGFRTAQFGFIPANVFCIALYAVNLRSWRKPEAE
jgi:hypothetical protein